MNKMLSTSIFSTHDCAKRLDIFTQPRLVSVQSYCAIRLFSIAETIARGCTTFQWKRSPSVRFLERPWKPSRKTTLM
jgi:hypothetical protein